jgi:penicillin-binding protein 1C
MLQQYKSPRFYNTLRQCGFTTLTHPAIWYGMSLILGGCEVTPFELAGVYSSFARMYLHQSINKGKWNDKDWFMPKYYIRNKEQETREEEESGNQQSNTNPYLIIHPSGIHSMQ